MATELGWVVPRAAVTRALSAQYHNILPVSRRGGGATRGPEKGIIMTQQQQLTAREWSRVLSRRHWKPGVEAVAAVSASPNVLRLKKASRQRLFGACASVTFKPGQEIELVAANTGPANSPIPGWAREQLGLGKGDVTCITSRDGKFYLKRLMPERRPTHVPGCTVIDRFDDTIATRTYSLSGDLASITPDVVASLLEAVGTFCRDPVASYRDLDSPVGLLGRRELLGDWTERDRTKAAEYRAELAARQQADGSWQDSAVATAFAIVRLLELGATPAIPEVAKAVDWLLTTREPPGFPGCFMVTETAARDLAAWKRVHSGADRGPGNARKAEKALFLDNRDVAGAGLACEVRITSATPTVLEALLRCGLCAQPRVVRAINTLLAVRGARWCGCGYFVANMDLPDSSAPVDFEHPPASDRPFNETLLGWPVASGFLPWATSEADVLRIQLDADRAHGHQLYEARQLGECETLMMRESDAGSGNCVFSVNRGLSWHPNYPGSALEALAAIECEGRQAWDGTWGRNSVPGMFSLLERFASCPVAAFVALRSVPFLIRRQRHDGLWSEQDLTPNMRFAEHALSPEVTTLSILRAFKRFGFIDALVPK